MRRFHFALGSDPELPGRSERIQAGLKEYDAVLYEWNDNLNLNLALMGAYFGERARDWLDFELYEQFKQVGAELEDYYPGSVRGSEVGPNLAQIEADLDSLGNQVYQLGVFMMIQLRDGAEGRTAPDRVDASPSPREVRVPAAPGMSYRPQLVFGVCSWPELSRSGRPSSLPSPPTRAPAALRY